MRFFFRGMQPKLSFQLESSVSLPLKPSGCKDAFNSALISVYKHADSEFRCVFVPLPGPLVSLNILVPTLAENHKGLAHTLEHLVFCGSRLYPQRGYLDYLATRNLSTGTNAYTTEDHTCYQITTAGAEAMLNVLPVFMDHVFYPTLRDAQFTTEIYHVDGEGKHQGVVYCEMASREHTESDKLDLCLRQLLYQHATTYAYECGGLTRDIKHLTNQEIKEYHQRYYHINNASIILCGEINPQKVFDALSTLPSHFLPPSPTLSAPPLIVAPALPCLPTTFMSQQVSFPTEDESVGSIGYGWRGPGSNEFETLLALEVLLRYLQDTPASPFYQAFVEIENPIASDVDFDPKYYVESSLFLLFSGVPFKSIQESESESESDDKDESSESDEMDQDENSDSSDAMSESNVPSGYYFEPGIMHQLVMNVLQHQYETVFVQPETRDKLKATLVRHCRKVLESLEEDPHELIAAYVVCDLVRYHVGPPSLGCTKSNQKPPQIGAWSRVFTTLDALSEKPLSFWRDLLKTWLLDGAKVEVKMVPSAELALQQRQQEQQEQAERAALLGPQGLRQLKERVDQAVLENQVHVPPSLIQTMPPVPDIAHVPHLPAKMTLVPFPVKQDTSRPVMALQIVSTVTAFAHVRFFFNTQHLADSLRPFLVLFQEMLFQTAIWDKHVVDYKTVVQMTSDLLISHEAAMGLGNELFHASWLSEAFILGGSSPVEDVDKMVHHVVRILAQSLFEPDRILTIAKNLLTEIADLKRNGSEMLVAISTRLTSRQATNERAMSLFKQEAFLTQIIQQIKDGNSQEIVDALNQIQEYFLFQDVHQLAPSFVQVSLPESSATTGLLDAIMTVWNHQVEEWKSRQTVESPRKKLKSSGHRTPSLPFPFPRLAYQLDHIDTRFGSHVMVPISGLSTSFISQLVPCDVMIKSPSPKEAHAVAILCELISRTEGPLYSAVRGNGLAYGAYVEVYLWSGQLSIDIRDSSEPHKALLCFYDIIESLQTEQGWNELCSDEHVETARASTAYRACAGWSTAASVTASILRSTLRGFTSLEQERDYQNMLYQVTRQDIRHVYEKYFTSFLQPEKRLTVMTTVPGEMADTLQKAFMTGPPHRQVLFNQVDLSDLQL